MRRPFLFLIAFALLASFVDATDRQNHPQILIEQQAAETPDNQPVPGPDAEARLKFPKVDAEVIDTMAFVNRLVNANISGVSDREQYGVDEMWVQWPESGKGDCEDYQLSKMGILSNSGYPSLLMRIVGVIVNRPDGSTEGHAILEIVLPDSSHAFMDNLHDEMMTKAELEAEGYDFLDKVWA